MPSARERLAATRVGRLATVRPNGAPHLVPIVFALEGDRLYSAIDDKPKRTPELQRLSNIAAEPRVSVLADEYDEDWSRLWWVRVDGLASVMESGPEHARALDALAAKFKPYRRRRPTGPVILVEISRWSSWPED